MSSSLLVGHLVSGGGTTMENVARRMLAGELGNIRPSVVIANKVCDALVKAAALGIPTELIQKSDFDGDKDRWAEKISSVLQRYQANIVFQNGWTPRTPQYVIERWPRIMNQHPGPLSGNGKPDFGGTGMCGAAVTAARILYLLEAGEQDPKNLTTESTVHMVTPLLDEGHLVRVQTHNIAEIIAECRSRGIVNIVAAGGQRGDFDELVRTAQKELLLTEHDNVAQVLQDRAEGRITRVDKDGRATSINVGILERVKAAAINMYPTK